MKTTNSLWIKHLAMGAAIVALSPAVLARGPTTADAPDTCAPISLPQNAPMMHPPPRMSSDAPPPGLMPQLPFLRGVELTEAQEDRMFELLMAQAPVERAKVKKAFKAMDELRRLASSDRFDVDKARVLAETHASTLVQLALTRAELEANVRALLTPEQRKQLDDASTKVKMRRIGATRS